MCCCRCLHYGDQKERQENETSKAFIPILLCILRLPASPKSSINPYSLRSFSDKVTLSNLHPSLFKCGSHSTPWTWPDWPNQKQFPVGNYTSRKQARKTFNSVPKETDYNPFPISLQESLKFGQTFACNFLGSLSSNALLASCVGRYVGRFFI